MPKGHRSVNRLTQEAGTPRRRLRIVIALVAMLSGMLLGSTLALSSHGEGSQSRSGEVSEQAAHNGPAMSPRPSPSIFVGTVPDAPIDERAISPMETVGASSN